MAIDTNINEALLQDLLAIYTDAENQMLEKVAKRVKKGITEEGWNEGKLQDVQQLRKEVESLLNNKSKLAKLKVGQGILKAYKAGVNSAEKDAGKPLTAMKDLDVPLSIQNMLLANYNLIDDANSRILRNVNDAYRDAMAESATGLLSGVDTRVQASQKMMDRLAAKGITSFTDKAGRKWQMSTYTEMAMRTASAHAAIEGHIQTQQSFGMDLMEVSRIGTTCPICARWQGVVLSISGKTPGYHTVDEARAAGLFHPNCKHTIVMFDPELDGEGQKELNSDETVEKYTDKYDLLQQQRANERAIRYWKRREAAAIDPNAKKAYKQRVNASIAKNIAFCDQYGLRRMPKREGFKTGDPKKAYTVGVGQNLKNYTSLSDDSVKALNDMGFSIPSKNQKVSVSGQLKKAAAGDNKGSMVSGLSDTEAYKKIFGAKPTEIYKSLGGEAGTGMSYAKWLSTTVKTTKSEPFIYEDELKAEIKDTSLTSVYKKYIGPDPSPDFKAAGGEEGTGLKYAQWLKAQVNKLSDPNEAVIPQGKTTFDNSAVSAQQSKTKKLADQVDIQQSQQKASKLETEIKVLKNQVSSIEKTLNVDGNETISGVWPTEKYVFEYEELKASGSIQKKKAYYQQKIAEDPDDGWAKKKLKQLEYFEIDGEEYLANKEMLENKKKSLKSDEDELAKIKPLLPKPEKIEVKPGDLTPEKARKLAYDWASEHPKSKRSLSERTKWAKEYFKNSTGTPDHLVDASFEPYIVRDRAWRDKDGLTKAEKEARMGWYTLYEYTLASGKLNWPARGVDRQQSAQTNDPDMRGKSEIQYFKERGKFLDKLFDNAPGIPKDITLKRKADIDALLDFLGLGKDSRFDYDLINKRIEEVNAVPGSYVGSDKAWSSMGTSKEATWSGNVGFVTRAVKGTKAIYSEPISHYAGGKEIETLLKRDQKQRCIQILRKGDPFFESIVKDMGWNDSWGGPGYIIVTETIPD